MKGEQKSIYDSIRKMMNGDTSNLSYVDGDEVTTLNELLEHNKPYSGSLIKDAKQAKEALSEKVIAKIDSERTIAVEVTEQVIEDLKGNEDYGKLSTAQQNTILQPIEEQLAKVRTLNYIGVIRDVKNTVQTELATKQLNELVKLANPIDDEKGGGDTPKVHYINKSNVKPKYSKSELRTEDEVQEYVDAYKEALLEVIRTQKRIKL
jgi:hypothetical protein